MWKPELILYADGLLEFFPKDTITYGGECRDSVDMLPTAIRRN